MGMDGINFMKTTEQHLGGYIEGGDEATYFPTLWTWLVKHAGMNTILDLGCGEGHSTSFFADLGAHVLGVDGVPQDHPNIITHDFTTGPWEPPPPDEFDLVWCCEFVEHIEEKFIQNIIPALRAGRTVLMTHAFPGQAGHHHVNCRDAEYWKGFMTAAGFTYEPMLTELTRTLTKDNPSEYNHYLRSGMAFIRT